MISPELLRRYPFFAPFDNEQLKAIAMLAEEVSIEQGAVIFEEKQTAQALFLLMDGSVDLFNVSEEQFHPKNRKEFSVGEINPGEVFGMSAMIAPYLLTATARASKPSRLIEMKAIPLRQMMQENSTMGYRMMCQIAAVAVERLDYARIQLAARSP